MDKNFEKKEVSVSILAHQEIELKKVESVRQHFVDHIEKIEESKKEGYFIFRIQTQFSLITGHVTFVLMAKYKKEK